VRSKKPAFTLVEMLLVLAIIGIVTAVAMPTFVQSLRGNRLRAAARTVAAAGRYARSMAVMRQEETVMALDLDSGSVAVNVPGAAPPASDAVEQPPSGPAAEPAGGEDNRGSGAWSGGISRKLDRVRITEVTSESMENSRRDGIVSVIYRTNGTCTPYSVRIEDSEGDILLVSVDALSSAKIGGPK
jgi:prepilin-type N-terminal cleavage/methylation domain-containing protein